MEPSALPDTDDSPVKRDEIILPADFLNLVDVLQAIDAGHTTRDDIADETERDGEDVEVALTRLRAAGAVTRHQRGHYSLSHTHVYISAIENHE